MNAARSRSRVSSCRCHAASTLGRSTPASRCGVSAVTTPSSRTPAAWITAVSGCAAWATEASSAATAWAASATSHAAIAHLGAERRSAPRPARRPARPARPGPLRLASSRCRIPWTVTRCRGQLARRAPPAAAGDQHRSRRRPSGIPAWAAVLVGARASGGRSAGDGQLLPSRTTNCCLHHSVQRSASRTQRGDGPSPVVGVHEHEPVPDAPACAERTRPHSAALPRCGGLPIPRWHAPRVTTTMRRTVRVGSSASHCCTSRQHAPRTAVRRPPARGSRTGRPRPGHRRPPHPWPPAGSRRSPPRRTWHERRAPRGRGGCWHRPPGQPGPSPAAATRRPTQVPQTAPGHRRPQQRQRVHRHHRQRPRSVDREQRRMCRVQLRVQRARSAVAPAACRVTPVHAYGSQRCRSTSARRRTIGCRTASSRAGCSPKRAASSRASRGSSTSAKRSSPRSPDRPISPWNGPS